MTLLVVVLWSPNKGNNIHTTGLNPFCLYWDLRVVSIMRLRGGAEFSHSEYIFGYGQDVLLMGDTL